MTTPARQRREQERTQARRTILAAARELGSAEGWDAVTMRKLADRIAYSTNFAYRYYSGREEILAALVRDGFAQLLSAVQDAAGRAGDPADAARRGAHAYLRFALDELDLYQLMYGLGGLRMPARDTWAEGQAIGDALAELFTAAGVPDAAEEVLRLWGTAHGLVALLAVGRVGPDRDRLTALLDGAIDRVLAGGEAP